MNFHLIIDETGHVALPQTLREELHLSTGDILEIDTAGEEITLRPIRQPALLVYEQGIPVLYTGSPLSNTTVEDTIHQVRRKRDLGNFGPTG